MSRWNPDPYSADYHENQARQARVDRGEDRYTIENGPTARAPAFGTREYLALPCPWPGYPEKLSTIGEVLVDFQARGVDSRLADYWVMGARHGMATRRKQCLS